MLKTTICGWSARGSITTPPKPLLGMAPSEARSHSINRKSIMLAMKLTIVLLTAAFFNVHASGVSQTITLSGSNISFKEVVSAIEKQTGYLVFCKKELLEKTRPVTLKVDNIPLTGFLELVLHNQALAYRIDGKTIFISATTPGSSEKSAVVVSSDQQLPPTPIRIQVLDSTGNPLAGASVSIKNSKISGVTDAEGFFTLNANEGDVITVTFVGYEPRQVIVTPSMFSATQNLVITLKPSITNLEDVEVTVSTGYQNIPKERATGSFTQPDKEMFNSRVSLDAISKLDGITSGLVFYKGVPSGNSELRVRGQSTIFANAQPLIIIDNFPYDGNINNINPNDIENITVLKDAAASSIWGVRAGNGVIVITTKKGQYNRPAQINFSSNITTSKKPNLLYDPNYISSEDFVKVEKFLFANNYYNGDLSSTNQPPISPVVEILNKNKLGLISSTEADNQIRALTSGLDVRNDISKLFYQNAIAQQNSLNINGGNEKMNYFFSAGNDNNRSNRVGDNLRRNTISSTVLYKPIQNLEITGGITYAETKSNSNNTLQQLTTGGANGKLGILPYTKLTDADGNSLPILKGYRQSYVQNATSLGFLNWEFSPYRELQDNLNKTQTTDVDIRVTAGIRYTIVKGLNAELKYQNEKGTTDVNNLINKNAYYARNLINQFSSVSSSGNVTDRNIPNGGILFNSAVKLNSQNIRGQISYDNSWNKHLISSIAGIEQREITSDLYGSNLYGYDDDFASFSLVNYNTFYDLNPAGVGSSLIPSGSSVAGNIDRFRSYFANLSYSYDGKYTFTASGRIDGSNFFGVKTNQKNVPLWSIGGKWDIDKESFYHISFLPTFKLRATYGYQGNLDRSVSAYTTAEYASGNFFNGNTYVIIQNPPNPQLRWEKSGILNVGIDFSLPKNVLSGSVEYFQKNGNDLIGYSSLAPTSGITGPTGSTVIKGNFAAMTGHGIDVQLNANIINRTFKWSSSFLLSHSIDKVSKYTGNTLTASLVQYADGGNGGGIYPKEGYPVYGIYGYKFAGLDHLTGDPQGYVNGALSKDYPLLTNPSDFNEVKYIGSARPTYFGGFRNTLSYRNLSILANISYKLGYFFRRKSIEYNYLFSQWIGHKDFTNRWQNPGDETKTNVPSLTSSAIASSARDNFYRYSDVLVEKGDHIRLQDVSVSYDINKKVWNNSPFRKLQIFVYANNIGIIWKANKEKLDPDFPTQGFVTPATYSIGIKGGF
jgi:TonB-linked SusC/RagA family outer membrane protein